MWPFKKKKTARCGICSRRLTLLEWEDLRETPEDPPYRCPACGRVFCFRCLDKRKGAVVSPKSYVLELVCPLCGASKIKYALRIPFPEAPEETVRRRAKELQAKHGALVEARCLADNNVELMYGDGTVVDGKLGEQTKLITCGYAGQGPRQFHAFLTESGFQISVDEVYDRRPPYVLRPQSR
jgi:DNA-directed RNA polymerase subunit RPC12/RpoP